MFLRLTKGIFRSAWWLLVVSLLLVAVYVSLGRLLSWSVAANQDQIEALLKDNGLSYVELGTISGEWQIHDPRVIARNISVQPLGEPALEIDSLTFRLASIRSLLNRTPIITEIEISGIRFTLERDDDKFWIKGFKRGDGKLNVDLLLDSIPHLQELTLEGIDISLVGPGLDVHVVSQDGHPWRVSAEGQTRHLAMPLLIETKMADASVQSFPLSLSGSYEGDLRSPDFIASLFLEAPHINVESFLPTLVVAGKEFTGAQLTARAWVELGPNEVDLSGELGLSNISLDSRKVLDLMSSSIRFHGDSLGNGTLVIPSVSLSHGAFAFRIEDISVAIDSSSGVPVVVGKLDSLNVSEVVRLIDFASQQGIVTERLATALTSVAPAGELEDLRFVANPDDGSPRLVSRLVNYSMQAYLGVPAIDRLNGFISLRPDSGYLDIDNDAFQMRFREMFDSPWTFDSGRGRIAYRVGENSVNVSSGLIELIDGSLSANGKLSLNLPPVREMQTWGLTIGITDADLLTADRYIPNNIPDELRGWLKSAIGGGTGQETGLTIHGALFRGSPADRKAHDLYFKVDDVSIAYHPDWPVANSLSAIVHLNNHQVRADGAIGRMYESDLSAISVLIPIPVSGKADTVLISGDMQGPFQDALRALRETPLAGITSNMAAEWSGEGHIHGKLSLNVPIGERGSEQVQTDLNMSIDRVLLRMPDFDLTVLDLAGNLTYSDKDGLNSNQFVGVTFNKPITGKIDTELKGEGGEIVVSVDGNIDAASLYQWSGQILLSRVSGDLAYQTRIHIPFGGLMDEVSVEAFSDLTGVVVDLPVPLAKPDKDSKHDFRYRQEFGESGYRVDLSMDNQIQASLNVDGGVTTGGRIHFGSGTFGAVTYDAIRMTGTLPYLDYEQWQLATEQLGEVSEVAIEKELAAHVASLELHIDEFMVYDLPLDDVNLQVTRGEASWVAWLQNRMVAGKVTVFDEDAPLELNLSKLSFDSEGEASDPFSEVSPVEITDVNFHTDQLLLDGDDFGQWSFEFRTSASEARFENLTARTTGVQVLPGSLVRWGVTEGQHQSSFEGDILIDNLAEALKKFGFASSIEGEGLRLKAAVGWQGSPAMVDVEKIEGAVEIIEGKGRFVQAETGGALKVLGIFDFASLARRFRLDFSDVLEQGFEFNDINGATIFEDGVIQVQEPIVIDGSSGKFTVGGTVNLATGVLDNDMIVTLPVGRTLPWYAAYSAIATGPLAGAGVMLAQKVFENQINTMSSAKYKISGTIDQPDIEFVSIFDDKVREAPLTKQ